MVSAALDAGIDFIDYRGRLCRRPLGGGARPRARKAAATAPIIATKVYGDLAGEALIAACEASLRRLRTDYVDAYYLHWPNPDIPIADVARRAPRT